MTVSEIDHPHDIPQLVTRADIPLCCPRPNAPLWNQHPRIYLPIEETGKVVCPYCDARYILVDTKTT